MIRCDLGSHINHGHEWNLWQTKVHTHIPWQHFACDNGPIASEMILRKSLFFYHLSSLAVQRAHYFDLHTILRMLATLTRARTHTLASHTHAHTPAHTPKHKLSDTTRTCTSASKYTPGDPHTCTKCKVHRAQWATDTHQSRRDLRLLLFTVSKCISRAIPASFHLYFGLHSCGYPVHTRHPGRAIQLKRNAHKHTHTEYGKRSGEKEKKWMRRQFVGDTRWCIRAYTTSGTATRK